MAAKSLRDRPHLFLPGGGVVEPYRRPNQKIKPPALPVRDRARHAAALEASIRTALEKAHLQLNGRDADLMAGTPGFYLEVEIPARERAVIDLLANRGKKLEVVAVGPSDDAASVIATVFVPRRAENYFLDRVREYRDEETSKGRPRHEKLVSRMDTVRLATLRSLFTDPSDLFPIDPLERIWWEVWLRDGKREAFERLASALELGLKNHAVRFPEREVVLALADSVTLQRLVVHSDFVAELRRAKDTPAFFLDLRGAEQRAWGEDLLERLTPSLGVPIAVCLLDSGVRRRHPLIEPLLSAEDWHTIQPAWGPDDSATWRGHGTAMAGIALYGDLVEVLVGSDPISPAFCLESVRILPPEGQANDPDLYGAITAEAIARAEIQAPRRRRVSVCSVTSEVDAQGRPSSWSAAVDQLCFEEPDRRLVILSAGNLRGDLKPDDYLVHNDLGSVQDPGQAWNALTVGAFTEKVDILDREFSGWLPIAPAGELAPRSRTSVGWDRQWPIKPDVVLEGGNLAHDGSQPGQDLDDLQLLTTYFLPEIRHFTTLGDTSAAAALAANMAGSILAERPRLWPETVRGLIVHSAEWTPPMRARMNACNGRKTQIQALLRRYGYGVPSLDRALRSARNDMTLMIEDELVPFELGQSSQIKMREMKLHTLPWPRTELALLDAEPVEIRVTLSYFVEPNPGERGWTRKHRYASHGLRFRLKAATESLNEFRARINQAARDEEEGGGTAARGGEEWLIGTARDTGSIHSDFWHGTAADLATRDAVGVFPVGGWWKEKKFLGRFETPVRYALIVTIRAPTSRIDIYTAVEQQVAVAISNEV